MASNSTDPMPSLTTPAVGYRYLLLITFIESAATAIIERGIFFYTKDQLGFTETFLVLADRKSVV